MYNLGTRERLATGLGWGCRAWAEAGAGWGEWSRCYSQDKGMITPKAWRCRDGSSLFRSANTCFSLQLPLPVILRGQITAFQIYFNSPPYQISVQCLSFAMITRVYIFGNHRAIFVNLALLARWFAVRLVLLAVLPCFSSHLYQLRSGKSHSCQGFHGLKNATNSRVLTLSVLLSFPHSILSPSRFHILPTMPPS